MNDSGWLIWETETKIIPLSLETPSGDAWSAVSTGEIMKFDRIEKCATNFERLPWILVRQTQPSTPSKPAGTHGHTNARFLEVIILHNYRKIAIPRRQKRSVFLGNFRQLGRFRNSFCTQNLSGFMIEKILTPRTYGTSPSTR